MSAVVAVVSRGRVVRSGTLESVRSESAFRVRFLSVAGLDDEARALRSFLAAREATVYRRYARWWDRLPAGEVRRLA